ncbi:MAG TPA: SUMF1/EgtB/PvdO family nonheme iron enzyme, partial [Roseiflexaceae bacterium]
LAWNGPLPLPILIQLRRFAEGLDAPPDGAGPLLDHIERVLSGDRLRPLVGHLQDRLEAGSVVLLLDGLDEIADDARRAWVARAVALFQSRFSASRIVLTSRVYAYRDPCLLPPPFQVATLQPLDDQDRDDFIARWYRAALLHGSELAGEEQAQAADTKSHDLIDALGRRPRLREIATNPLLLTMIALVHQHRLRLPQQRARLYEECLLLLLEQWEQRRAEGGPAGLAAALGVSDQIDRLALIQPLAYELQVRGREEAGSREARTWLLERFLDLAQGDGARAKALIEKFLDFLEGRSGLLIARDIKDRYAFPHKTFQEYLAARELVYQGSKKTQAEVIAQRHAATWREVILLVAGHLIAGGLPQEAKLLGWRLLEADADGSVGFYRSAVLAGELVEELGGTLGRDGQSLKEQVVRALVALIQGGHLSAIERVDAAFLLARLGDPRLPTPDQTDYWCAIEPGPFWYGDDNAGKPLRQVALPYAFTIGRYAVTNAEYRHFIDDGGYDAGRDWWTPEGRKWLQRERRAAPYFWDDSRYSSPTQPVVGVTWYEAAAYCTWLTGRGHAQGWLPAGSEIRLPTSLEWERAARGREPQRYPWPGADIDVERANFKDIGIGRPAPVGCFPQGAAACGALDMVGNTMEWMATSSGERQALEPRKDFTRQEGVLRAYNDFRDDREQMCCGARDRDYPFIRGYDLGFRIVWSLAAQE